MATSRRWDDVTPRSRFSIGFPVTPRQLPRIKQVLRLGRGAQRVRAGQKEKPRRLAGWLPSSPTPEPAPPQGWGVCGGAARCWRPSNLETNCQRVPSNVRV